MDSLFYTLILDLYRLFYSMPLRDSPCLQMIYFLVVTALITGAFSAAEVVWPSIRADDVTLTLEPVLTGGFNVVLIEGK